MVAQKTAWAPFSVLTPGALVNVSAPGVGSLAIDTATGALTLCDAAGGVLAASSAPPAARAAFPWPYLAGSLPPPPPRLARNDTCPPRQNGMDVSGPIRSDKFPNGLAGQTEDQCCAACNTDDTVRLQAAPSRFAPARRGPTYSLRAIFLPPPLFFFSFSAYLGYGAMARIRTPRATVGP
jgi:hypothetical protein